MPGYPWLQENVLTGKETGNKLKIFQSLGVPYTDEDIAGAEAAVKGKTEIEALIAYLQSLGTYLE
jgi:cytochrome c oxidase cbb3-type subunit 2